MNTLNSNPTRSYAAASVPSGTLFAIRLEPPPVDITVQLRVANVTVPVETFQSWGSARVALVITVFTPVKEGGTPVQHELWSFATLRPLQGNYPVHVHLTGEDNVRKEPCGGSSGNATGNVTGPPPDCAATLTPSQEFERITISIIRGVGEALRCTHLDLLTLEGFRELFHSDWYTQPPSIAYLALLASLLAMMVVACQVDRTRAWGDECFLIPQTVMEPTTPEEPLTPARSQSLGPVNSMISERAAAPISSIRSAASNSITWVKQSSAARDAVDDVATRWFAYFSEVRDFVEGVWQGVDLQGTGESGGRVTRVCRGCMTSLISNSVLRQAGASLGLSSGTVRLVTGDPLLKECLGRRTGSRSAQGKNMQVWAEMHGRVIERVEEFWSRSAAWKSLPCSAARLFMAANPFTAVFLSDHFQSSSVRVLLLTCELFGSFMVATVFFIASGDMRGKRNRGSCMTTNAWELVGRLIIIGMGSLVVACIPVAVITKLHSRKFVMVDFEDGPEWRKQLKKWRFRDRLVWFFGLVYVLFSTFFVALFLANVAPKDMDSWALSGMISLVEDAVVIPLFTALLVPLLSSLALALASWLTGEGRSTLLENAQREKRELWTLARPSRVSV